MCPYCRDPARNRTQICVVEEPHNILPIETTRTFDGLYHVLHGSISPLRGIGPEQLKIKGLLERIGRGEATEIILATNPTVEGSHRGLFVLAVAEAAGRQGNSHRDGDSGGQRSGVRRRSDDVEVAGKSSRDVKRGRMIFRRAGWITGASIAGWQPAAGFNNRPHLMGSRSDWREM